MRKQSEANLFSLSSPFSLLSNKLVSDGSSVERVDCEKSGILFVKTLHLTGGADQGEDEHAGKKKAFPKGYVIFSF